MKLGLLSFVIISLVTPSLATVGFQQLSVPDSEGKPIFVFVWYPSSDVTTAQQLGGFSQMVLVDSQVLRHRPI
jgi:hypothetical protein